MLRTRGVGKLACWLSRLAALRRYWLWHSMAMAAYIFIAGDGGGVTLKLSSASSNVADISYNRVTSSAIMSVVASGSVIMSKLGGVPARSAINMARCNGVMAA